MTCNQENDIDLEFWGNVTENDISALNYENTKCFAKCFFEKTGIIDEEGKFQPAPYEEIVKKANHESGANVAEENCKDMQVATCEDAILMFQCLYKYLK